MASSIELKPCPFCGSGNIDGAEWRSSDGTSGPGCGDCGALGGSVETWNRRASEPSEERNSAGKLLHVGHPTNNYLFKRMLRYFGLDPEKGHNVADVLRIIEAAPPRETSAQHPDTARMDWLERQSVAVRTPAAYGSRDCFYTSPDARPEPGDPLHSDLRARVDAMLAPTTEELCDTCTGSGHLWGDCEHCGGTGTIRPVTK